VPSHCGEITPAESAAVRTSISENNDVTEHVEIFKQKVRVDYYYHMRKEVSVPLTSSKYNESLGTYSSKIFGTGTKYRR
jgi:hypothetical protein